MKKRWRGMELTTIDLLALLGADRDCYEARKYARAIDDYSPGKPLHERLRRYWALLRSDKAPSNAKWQRDWLAAMIKAIAPALPEHFGRIVYWRAMRHPQHKACLANSMDRPELCDMFGQWVTQSARWESIRGMLNVIIEYRSNYERLGES